MSSEIYTVLKSGGEYGAHHVRWLQKQIGMPIKCLTDLLYISDDVECIPLKHNWAGWWSKIELFRPDIKGDILYFDLDTVVLFLPEKYLNLKTPMFLRDAYLGYGGNINSGMMFLPADCKHRNSPYLDFKESPSECMRVFHGGDQHFLNGYFRKDCSFWQEIFPNEIRSYKCDLKEGDPCAKDNIVFFHGQPRPWDVKKKWIPQCI